MPNRERRARLKSLVCLWFLVSRRDVLGSRAEPRAVEPPQLGDRAGTRANGLEICHELLTTGH